MPTYYVSDYEELTGRKPDGSPLEAEVVTKVIAPPGAPEVAPATVAEVK